MSSFWSKQSSLIWKKKVQLFLEIAEWHQEFIIYVASLDGGRGWASKEINMEDQVKKIRSAGLVSERIWRDIQDVLL